MVDKNGARCWGPFEGQCKGYIHCKQVSSGSDIIMTFVERTKAVVCWPLPWKSDGQCVRQFRKIIGSEEGESLELTKFEVNDQEQDSYFYTKQRDAAGS